MNFPANHQHLLSLCPSMPCEPPPPPFKLDIAAEPPLVEAWSLNPQFKVYFFLAFSGVVKANNAYIFPGFGLGLVISGAISVHDDMLLAAYVLLEPGKYKRSPVMYISLRTIGNAGLSCLQSDNIYSFSLFLENTARELLRSPVLGPYDHLIESSEALYIDVTPMLVFTTEQ